MDSDRISIDIDDLDFQYTEEAYDFSLDQAIQETFPNDNSKFEESITLESILKEEDNLENDEILLLLNESLTFLKSNNFDKENAQSINITKKNIINNSFKSNSNHNLYERNGIVCKQAQLKQISSQLTVAVDRSEAGIPTSLTVSKIFAVGTSRGLILIFDLQQILKLYITTDDKDAITALALNNTCERLLVGNALGYIYMFDTENGKCLRNIKEAHPFGNSILHLKFTDDPKIACFSDSGGSVFMLEFKRIMGLRSADSTCIFSGSRGEVCHIEPLKFECFSQNIINKLIKSSNDITLPRSSALKRNLENINQVFQKYLVLAMVSFTKIFVVTLRPKLTVLFTYPMCGNVKFLPILNWQFVIMQSSLSIYQTKIEVSHKDPNSSNSKRFVTPILACARESSIIFFQMDFFYKKDGKNPENQNQSSNTIVKQATDLDHQFNFKFLKKSDYQYKIYNFCWLNAKTLAILDHTEKLHICDIRSNEEIQVITNLPECVQLVYNNSFFKSLSTGGYVSKALAHAGENACYQTFQEYLGQLFMLGSRSISIFSLQQWSSRIDDFVNDGNLNLALDLAISMYQGESKALIGLPIDFKLRREKITEKIVEVLYLYVNRAMKQDCPSIGKLDELENHYRKCSSKCVQVCMKIDRQDILFNNLYTLITCDKLFEGFFFESLEDYILSNKLTSISSGIISSFVEYYTKAQPSLLPNLEKCLLHFDTNKLKLDVILQLCQEYELWDAFISFHNRAYQDYITPFEDLIKMISPVDFLTLETAKHFLKCIQQDQLKKITTCGNKLLVYLCCCLCGQAYPYGNLNDDQLSDHIRRIIFDYLTQSRSEMIDKMLIDRLEKEKKRQQNGGYMLMSVNLEELIDPCSQLGEYPIIKIFLHFDALDFLNVISMAFNEPSFEAVIGLEKKQQIIDILIKIGLSRTSSSVNQGSTFSVYNNRLVGNLFTFLARQIANKNNNIKVENSIFIQIIEYLCNREEIDRIEEREQTLISLLNTFSFQIADYIDLDRILELATRAKFYRTCEFLYELRGEYFEIVECYLNPDNPTERQEKIFDVVRGILEFLGDCNAQTVISKNNKIIKYFALNHQQLSQCPRKQTILIKPREVQLKMLQETILKPDVIKKLLSMNPIEAIHLLWIDMNIDLKVLIKILKGFYGQSFTNLNKKLVCNKEQKDEEQKSILQIANEPTNVTRFDPEFQNRPKFSFDLELLFQFLKGLFDFMEQIKTDRRYVNYMSQFTGEYCELYVDLICRFEPDSLIFILKSILVDYNFRLDECLRICREHEHWDGTAFLLEKSGQVEAAFTLNLEKLSAMVKNLQKNLELLTETQFDLEKSKIDAHLVMIVQLCQRNSCSLSDQTKEKIWFSLFDEIMRPIRGLFIDPLIETELLNNQKISCNIEEKIFRHRLYETRDFFKRQGTYIINSMVGYLSLVTIIDRIICDPLYGASNFGDIKDLMLKMMEMCAYEQTLLLKTSNLVSEDVYSKMHVLKRLAAKSYSAFSNFCQICSRSFDLTQIPSEILSFSELNQQNITLLNNNTSPSCFDLNNDTWFHHQTDQFENQDKMVISIFNCGHSYHFNCLEIKSNSINENNFSNKIKCPVCYVWSTNFLKGGIKQKMEPRVIYANEITQKQIRNYSDLKYILKYKQISEDELNTNSPDETAEINYIEDDVAIGTLSKSKNLTFKDKPENEKNEKLIFDGRFGIMKSMRKRNLTNYDVDLLSWSNYNEKESKINTKFNQTKIKKMDKKNNTLLEKRAKLQLGPLNINNFL